MNTFMHGASFLSFHFSFSFSFPKLTITARRIKFKLTYYLLKGSVKFSFTKLYATFTVCKVNLYATVTPLELRKVCVMRLL